MNTSQNLIKFPYLNWWRRYAFLALVFALLCLPMLVHFLAKTPAPSDMENRPLATLPSWPKDHAAALGYTEQLNAYLNDHFGLRREMIGWNNRLRYDVFGEAASPQMTVGKNGYLFFNSHAAQYPLRMINFLCGKNIPQASLDELGEKVGGFMRQAKAVTPHTSMSFVPTKPVLYPEYLPSWLERECTENRPSLPSIMALVSAKTALNGEEFYPFDFMRQEKAVRELYPKPNFHWHGRGAQAYAEHLATQWQLKASHQLHFEVETVASDMQRFMPGLPLTIQIETPNYAASGINACLGAACYPEFPMMTKMADVSRYRTLDANVNKPRKLLLVSDSFGSGVAGYFSVYFDEVWHTSINNSGALNETDLQQLKREFESYAPDQVLYLFHDFSVSCFSDTLNYCPINLYHLLGKIHPSISTNTAVPPN